MQHPDRTRQFGAKRKTGLVLAALAAMLLVALSSSAPASAAWLHEWHPLESSETLTMAGELKFENENGGFVCHPSEKLELEPGTSSESNASITSVTFSEPCEEFGLMKHPYFGCEVTSTTAAGTPYTVSATGTQLQGDPLTFGAMTLVEHMNSGCIFGETIHIECPEFTSQSYNFGKEVLPVYAYCASDIGGVVAGGGLLVFPGQKYTYTATPPQHYPFMLRNGNWIKSPVTETFTGPIVYGSAGPWIGCEATVEMAIGGEEAQVTSFEASGCEAGGLLCSFIGMKAGNVPWNVEYTSEDKLAIGMSLELLESAGGACGTVKVGGNVEASVDDPSEIRKLTINSPLETTIGEDEISAELTAVQAYPEKFSLID